MIRNFRDIPQEKKDAVEALFVHQGMHPKLIARAVDIKLWHVVKLVGTIKTTNKPIGEITIFIDEHGRKIKKCPPGYAHGYYPGVTAKGRAA